MTVNPVSWSQINTPISIEATFDILPFVSTITNLFILCVKAVFCMLSPFWRPTYSPVITHLYNKPVIDCIILMIPIINIIYFINIKSRYDKAVYFHFELKSWCDEKGGTPEYDLRL